MSIHINICYGHYSIIKFNFKPTSYCILVYFVQYHGIRVHYSTFQYITVHYSTLQYITVHYSTLQYITVHFSTLQYITVHYSTLQYITVHYSTLQYIAVHQNPKPELCSFFSFSSAVMFLHWLQTSITQPFLKLEHFLRLFLKTSILAY